MNCSILQKNNIYYKKKIIVTLHIRFDLLFVCILIISPDNRTLGINERLKGLSPGSRPSTGLYKPRELCSRRLYKKHPYHATLYNNTNNYMNFIFVHSLILMSRLRQSIVDKISTDSEPL